MTRAGGRILLAAGLALVVCGSLVACSPSPEQIAADRLTVLERYLDGERAVMADLVSQTSEYEAGDVAGHFDGDAGAAEFPGTVVEFSYTYRDPVVFLDEDPAGTWREVLYEGVQTYPVAELEARKIALLGACTSTVFPAMRAAGLEGPLRVEYVYRNPGSGPEGWSMSCSSPSP